MLKRNSPPQCSAAKLNSQLNTYYSCCPTWNAIRAHHFTAANLLDLFNQVTPRCIVDFIKAIGFYCRICSSYRLSFLVDDFIEAISFFIAENDQTIVCRFAPTLYFVRFYQFCMPQSPILQAVLFDQQRSQIDRILARAFLWWCAVKHHTNKHQVEVSQPASIAWTTLFLSETWKLSILTMMSHLMVDCSIIAQPRSGKHDYRWLHDGPVVLWVAMPSTVAHDFLCQPHDGIYRRDTAVPSHWGTWKPVLRACNQSCEESAANVIHVEAASREQTWATRKSIERQHWGLTAV